MSEIEKCPAGSKCVTAYVMQGKISARMDPTMWLSPVADILADYLPAAASCQASGNFHATITSFTNIICKEDISRKVANAKETNLPILIIV